MARRRSGCAGLVGMLAFYYVAWQRAGRDPRAGTVVPIFSPPDDLSPAGMRYVTKMGVDNRTFAAALVDMGVKGHVRLIEEDRGWLSGKKTRLERLNGSTPLSEKRKPRSSACAVQARKSCMEQKNHEIFSSAKNSSERQF